MQRIAIIGNAGGGKSALAREMGDVLDLPVYTFDDLQWRPGWTRTPANEIQIMHSEWLAQPKWIIDGWGSPEILARRFETADIIILVDFPIAIHYWWAIKRQLKAVLHVNRGWPPEGCEALPVTWRLLKLMWKIHKEMLPELVELIHQYAQDTCIVHFKSPQEMKQFMKSLDE